MHVIGRKRGADVLRPLSPEHPDDETFEGLLILRPEGRLFFANAQNVADRINALIAEHRPRVVALDMSRVPDIEYSALQALIEGEKRATDRGIVVWLVGLNPPRARGRAPRRPGPAARHGAAAVQHPRGDRTLPSAAGRQAAAGEPTEREVEFERRPEMRTVAVAGVARDAKPSRRARPSIEGLSAST